MILYAACLNPLLTTLDTRLEGINITNKRRSTTAIAYADDVTIILRKPEEIAVVTSILNDYMKASGAIINVNKSQALALGTWPKSRPILNIRYDNIKIIGFHMSANTKTSALMSWTTLSTHIKLQAQENYHRALKLGSRIQYVNEILLASVWYKAQIFPPPTDIVKQINAAISYFIWKGSIFKVPLSTLQKPKREGGRALINVMAKCMTLFVMRMEKQCTKKGTLTAEWIRTWTRKSRPVNPPDITHTPKKLNYILRYILEMAYIMPQRPNEKESSYKK